MANDAVHREKYLRSKKNSSRIGNSERGMGKKDSCSELLPLSKISSEILKVGINGCRKKRSFNGTFF